MYSTQKITYKSMGLQTQTVQTNVTYCMHGDLNLAIRYLLHQLILNAICSPILAQDHTICVGVEGFTGKRQAMVRYPGCFLAEPGSRQANLINTSEGSDHITNKFTVALRGRDKLALGYYASSQPDTNWYLTN